eukprot:TRINITY_DN3195_c0_g1_i6.p1 TRINITY_DN3195_c0_g1~~TRINITY_DN3195_c0_g1_i6.p1  ORF type:complete len:2135 (-),score=760.79 TRINITY_DN3195_c0_g1_i6:62-6466(-)
MNASDSDVENKTSKNFSPKNNDDEENNNSVKDVYIASHAADLKVNLSSMMSSMKNNVLRLKSMENENHKLNEFIKEQNEKINEKTYELIRVKNENQELREDLEISKRSKIQFETKIKILERENEELKCNLDAKIDTYQKIKSERDELYGNIDEFTQDKRKHEHESNEYVAQIDRLKMLNKNLQVRLDDENEVNERLKSELNEEKLKLVDTDKVINGKVEEATEHLKSDLKQYRRDILDLKKKLVDLENAYNEHDKLVIDSKAELSIVEKENSSLRLQIEKLTQQIPITKQYNDVQTSTELLNDEIEKIYKSMKEAKVYEDLLTKKEEEFKDIQRELEKTNLSADAFQDNFTPLFEQRNQEIFDLKNSLKESNITIIELMKDVSSLKEYVETLNDECNRLKNENRKHSNTIDENKTFLRDAEEKLSHLNEIRINLQKKTEENLLLYHSERQLKNENRELNFRLVSSIDELQIVKSSNEKLREECQELEEMNLSSTKEQQKRIIDLSVDLEANKNQNKDLQERLNKSEENAIRIGKMLANTKRELNMKLVDFENIEIVLEERFEEIKRLSNVEKENQDLKDDLRNNEQKIRQLKNNTINLEDSIKTLSSKNYLLETQLKGIKNENDRMNTMMEIRLDSAENKANNIEKLKESAELNLQNLKIQYIDLEKKYLELVHENRQIVCDSNKLTHLSIESIEDMSVGIQADIDPTTQMAVNILSTKILELIDVSDFNDVNLLQSFERVVNQCQLLVNLANQRNEKIKILEEEIAELNSENDNLAMINNELSSKLEGFTEGNFTDDHVGELAKYFDALKKSSIIIYNALELFDIRMNDLFDKDNEFLAVVQYSCDFDGVLNGFEKLKKGELQPFESQFQGYFNYLKTFICNIIQEFKRIHEGLSVDVSKYQTALKKLQERRNELTSVIQNLNDRYENVTKENNENVSKLKEQHELLLEEKEKEIENIVENNEKVCGEYLSEIENLREETEKLQDRLLKEKSSELSELLQQLEKERKESEDSLDEQRALFEMKNLEHEELIKSLKSKHDENIEELLKERDLKERELLERLSMALAEHDTVMKKFMIDHEESIVESKEKLEMELEKINQSHNIEINDLKANHEIELTDLKTFYENELMEVNKHVEDIQNNSEIKLKTIVERHQQELTRVEVEYKTKVNQSEAEYRGKIDEITKLQTAHESSINQLSRSFDSRVAEIYNSHSNERDRLIEDYEDRLDSLRKRWSEELQSVKQTHNEEISKLKNQIVAMELSEEKSRNEHNNMRAQYTYYEKLSTELINENTKLKTDLQLHLRFVNSLLPTFRRLNTEFNAIEGETNDLESVCVQLKKLQGFFSLIKENEGYIGVGKDDRSNINSPARSVYKGSAYDPLFADIEGVAILLGLKTNNDATRMIYDISKEVELLLEQNHLAEIDSNLVGSMRTKLTDSIKNEGKLKQQLMIVEQENDKLNNSIQSLQNEIVLLKENEQSKMEMDAVNTMQKLQNYKEEISQLKTKVLEMTLEISNLNEKLNEINKENSELHQINSEFMEKKIISDNQSYDELTMKPSDSSKYTFKELCGISKELYELLMNAPFIIPEKSSELEFTPGSPSKGQLDLFSIDEEQKKLDIFWDYAYLINEHYSSLLFNESIDKTVNLLDHKSELDIVDLSSKSLRIILETFKQQSEFSSFTNFITKDDSKLTKLFIGPFVTIIWLCKQMIFYREVSKRHEVTIMEDLTRTQLIKNDNNNMKEKMHDMEAELLILRDQIIDLESSNERNEKEFKKLTLHCVDLENDNKKKDKKLKDMTIDVQRFDDLYIELERERKERLKLARVNKDLSDTLTSIDDNEIFANVNGIIKNVDEEDKKKIAKCNVEIEDLKRHCNVLNEKFESKRKGLNVALRQIDKLKEEKEELENSLNLRIQLTENLQEQLKESQNSLNSLNSTKSLNSPDTNNELLFELKTLTNELSHLENQNQSLRKTISLRDKQLIESTSIVENLENQLKSVKFAKIDSKTLTPPQKSEKLAADTTEQLELMIKQDLEDIFILNSSLEEKNKELDNATTLINNLKAKIFELEQVEQKKNQNNSEDDHEHWRLNTELFSLNKRHKQLFEQYRKTLLEISYLPSTYPQVKKAKSQLKKLNEQSVDLSRV